MSAPRVILRGGAAMLGQKRCLVPGRQGLLLAQSLSALGYDAEMSGLIEFDVPQPARRVIFTAAALPMGVPPWLQPISAFDGFVRLHRHVAAPELARADEADGAVMRAIGPAAAGVEFLILALPRVRTAEAAGQARAVAALLG